MDIEGLIKGIPQTSPESSGGENTLWSTMPTHASPTCAPKQSQMLATYRRPAGKWLL